MTALLVRTLTVVACIALAAALWKYWSTVCNEACSPGRALSMQFLCVALPAAVASLVYASSMRQPSSLIRLASWILVALLLAWALFVSIVR